MQYLGIGIHATQKTCVVSIPSSSTYGKSKEVLQSRTTVLIDIFGLQVAEPTFIFELKAILEEFIGKRLSQFTHGDTLNTDPYILGDGYAVLLYRVDNSLFLLVRNVDTGEEWSRRWNMIQAKTLYAILNKAIQQITIMEDQNYA